MTERLQDSKVLVTGAGGFIGSALIHRLHDIGTKVSAFLRYTSRADTGLIKYLPDEVKSDVEIIFGDLRDGDAVEKA